MSQNVTIVFKDFKKQMENCSNNFDNLLSNAKIDMNRIYHFINNCYVMMSTNNCSNRMTEVENYTKKTFDDKIVSF